MTSATCKRIALELSSPQREQPARVLRWMIEEQRAPTTREVARHFGWSYSHALVVMTRLLPNDR